MKKEDNISKRDQVAAAKWLARALRQNRGIEKRARDYVTERCKHRAMKRREACKLARNIAKSCPLLAAQLLAAAMQDGFRMDELMIAPWTVQYGPVR